MSSRRGGGSHLRRVSTVHQSEFVVGRARLTRMGLRPGLRVKEPPVEGRKPLDPGLGKGRAGGGSRPALRTWSTWGWVNSRRPRAPWVRPKPLALMPPKGAAACAVGVTASLTATIPASSRRGHGARGAVVAAPDARGQAVSGWRWPRRRPRRRRRRRGPARPARTRRPAPSSGSGVVGREHRRRIEPAGAGQRLLPRPGPWPRPRPPPDHPRRTARAPPRRSAARRRPRHRAGSPTRSAWRRAASASAQRARVADDVDPLDGHARLAAADEGRPGQGAGPSLRSGASGRTIAGSKPDSSATAGMPRAPAPPSTRRPFSTPPVNIPLSISDSTSARPTSAPPNTAATRPVGKPGLLEALLQPLARQRSQLRRLPDDGVARREGLGDRRGVEEERVVPGPDHPDHADRPPAQPARGHQQRTAASPGPIRSSAEHRPACLDGPADGVEGRNHVAGQRLAARLADLVADQVGPGVGVAGQDAPPPLEDGPAPSPIERAPARLGHRAPTTSATASGGVAGTRPSRRPSRGCEHQKFRGHGRHGLGSTFRFGNSGEGPGRARGYVSRPFVVDAVTGSRLQAALPSPGSPPGRATRTANHSGSDAVFDPKPSSPAPQRGAGRKPGRRPSRARSPCRSDTCGSTGRGSSPSPGWPAGTTRRGALPGTDSR